MRRLPLWAVLAPLLALANAAYFLNNFVGWAITLGFFLLVPGYLLLNLFQHNIESRWEIASFSLGLSLLVMMVGGLALNSLHAFGLQRPLTTPHVFAMLDVATLVLLGFNWRKTVTLRWPRLDFTGGQLMVFLVLTALPLLAAGGAIRLNNGSSNVLTMVLFAFVPVLLLVLVWRKNLAPLYPYAIFTIGLAVLFTTSLRGWYVTGHDIQHEFRVFYATSQHALWAVGQNGDPYNACLSVSILPTIIVKIATISAPYVFKVAFQALFALGVLPIYFLIKRLKNSTLALIGAFVFITFPAFLDDMPFINRQEIAFVFFALLISVTLMKMAQKSKIVLTVFLMFGLVLSHYSSGYTMLLLLLISLGIFKAIGRRFRSSHSELPLLRPSIIFTAILFTFLWNSQITASTSNLRGTVTKTLHSLVGSESGQDGFVQQYSLFGSSSHGPSVAESLAKYAGGQSPNVRSVAWPNLPVAPLGEMVSHIMDVETVNSTLHALVAKVFQVLVLLGVGLLIYRYRKSSSQREVYLVALATSSLVLLGLWTVLPQVSVDYTVIRLFQQTLAITALPIVLATEFLMFFFGRFKAHLVALFFGIVFLDLSGFIPQSLGGFLPQLSLNNTGIYYDYFYSHQSDITSSQWLAGHGDRSKPVAMDTNASNTLENFWIEEGLGKLTDRNAYLYQGYANTQGNVYRVFLGSGMVEFSDPSLTASHNLLYTNQASRVYHE